MRSICMMVPQVDNRCVLEIVRGCPRLAQLNVVGTRCTRELHRLLRQQQRGGGGGGGGGRPRLFGV
jgi:hypothetical protein